MSQATGRVVNRLSTALAALVLVGFSTAAVAQDKIVMLTWGGTSADFMRNIMSGPFEKETGIKIDLRFQENTLEGLTKLRAQKQDPDIDVWATSVLPALLAHEEGILERIPLARVPNARDVPPEMMHPSFVPFQRYFFGVVYNEKEVPFKISKWQDLWDPRLKGKVAVPHASHAEGKFVILLSYLSGGDEKNVEGAFDLAKKLAPNAGLYFRAYTEATKLLVAGEIAVAPNLLVGSGYLPLLKGNANLRFVAPEPFVIGAYDVFTVVKKKSGNYDRALKFINFALGKTQQEENAQQKKLYPVTRTATVPTDIAAYAPPEQKWRYVNDQVAKDQMPSWIERWNNEVQKR